MHHPQNSDRIWKKEYKLGIDMFAQGTEYIPCIWVTPSNVKPQSSKYAKTKI